MAAVTKKALKVAEMRICMMICPSTVISPWCGIEEIGSHRGAFYQAMCMIGGLSRLEVGSYVCTTCEVLQAGGLMVPWWGSQGGFCAIMFFFVLQSLEACTRIVGPPRGLKQKTKK